MHSFPRRWDHERVTLVATALRLLTRARTRLTGALLLHLSGPIKHSNPQPTADPQSLAPALNRGDVLLSHSVTFLRLISALLVRSV